MTAGRAVLLCSAERTDLRTEPISAMRGILRGMTQIQKSMETLGVAAARDQLGPLISKATIGRQPTCIKRSPSERAVLISEEAFEEYMALKLAREAAELAELIASTSRETIEREAYSSREQAYADLDLDVTDR